MVAVASRSDPEHAATCPHRRRSEALVRDGGAPATSDVSHRTRSEHHCRSRSPAWLDRPDLCRSRARRSPARNASRRVGQGTQSGGTRSLDVRIEHGSASVLRAPRLHGGRRDRRLRRDGRLMCDTTGPVAEPERACPRTASPSPPCPHQRRDRTRTQNSRRCAVEALDAYVRSDADRLTRAIAGVSTCHVIKLRAGTYCRVALRMAVDELRRP